MQKFKQVTARLAWRLVKVTRGHQTVGWWAVVVYRRVLRWNAGH